MTRIVSVEFGPLPLLVWGWEGTNLRLVKSLRSSGWALLGAAALSIAWPAVMAGDSGRAHAGATLEERKLPMRFNWVACQPNCQIGRAHV